MIERLTEIKRNGEKIQATDVVAVILENNWRDTQTSFEEIEQSGIVTVFEISNMRAIPIMPELSKTAADILRPHGYGSKTRLHPKKARVTKREVEFDYATADGFHIVGVDLIAKTVSYRGVIESNLLQPMNANGSQETRSLDDKSFNRLFTDIWKILTDKSVNIETSGYFLYKPN